MIVSERSAILRRLTADSPWRFGSKEKVNPGESRVKGTACTQHARGDGPSHPRRTLALQPTRTTPRKSPQSQGIEPTPGRRAEGPHQARWPADRAWAVLD